MNLTRSLRARWRTFMGLDALPDLKAGQWVLYKGFGAIVAEIRGAVVLIEYANETRRTEWVKRSDLRRQRRLP